ncbi:MAG: FadR/GntR family transcriptional regulator [Geminicoccaceae bacterium]
MSAPDGQGAGLPFEPIAQQRIASAVVAQIERLILEGVLRPGDRLPPERELAQQFGVSRPSLREALNELETAGLLETRHGGGSHVAPILGSAFDAPLINLFSRHRKATLDYIEFRIVIEGMAAALAAERATDIDRARLGRLIDEMRAAHQDIDPAREADIDAEFHMAVVESAHNVVLIHILRSILDLLRAGVFYNRDTLYGQPGTRDRLLAQHEAIFDAIIERNSEAARAAVAAHMNFVVTETAAAAERDAREGISRKRLTRVPELAHARRRARRGEL